VVQGKKLIFTSRQFGYFACGQLNDFRPFVDSFCTDRRQLGDIHDYDFFALRIWGQVFLFSFSALFYGCNFLPFDQGFLPTE